MKAVLLADFLSVKKSLGQAAFIAVVCGIIIGLACGDVNIIPPMLMFMMAVGQGFSLVALDEQNGWESYRGTFPVSRRDIIVGRMLFVLLIGLGFYLLGVVIAVILGLLAPLLTGISFLSASAITLDAAAMVVAFVGSLVALLVLLALCLPIIAKCGMTRAVRVLPLVFVIIFLVVICLGGASPDAFLSLDALMARHGFLILSLSLVLGAGLFILGGRLAVRFYEQREF